MDDDSAFRERLAKAMSLRGFETRTAASVAEAIELASSWPPSHAVIDLRMVGDSGLSLIEPLRKLNRDVRLIVLTGFGSIATAVKAGQLGASDYLAKPADADQLEAALRGHPRHAGSPPIQVPSLDRVEWEHVQRVLEDCDQNISKAARVLGIDRRSLQRKLKKYPPL